MEIGLSASSTVRLLVAVEYSIDLVASLQLPIAESNRSLEGCGLLQQLPELTAAGSVAEVIELGWSIQASVEGLMPASCKLKDVIVIMINLLTDGAVDVNASDLFMASAEDERSSRIFLDS